VAERRLPYLAEDDDGTRHQGEIVIARCWRADLPAAGAEFTVVLVQQPLEAQEAQLPSGVALCAPASAVRLPAAIREAAVAYGTDAPKLHLPPQARDAYANGSLFAVAPLDVAAREVFGNGAPRFDLLARRLLAAASRAERFWGALDEALSRPQPPRRPLRQDKLRARLARLLDTTPARPEAAEAIERLRRIAAGEEPEQIAPSPAALAEDVAFIRCLTERPDEALELATMRRYVEAAHPGRATGELASDCALTREQLSFIAVLDQPHQLDHMRATFEMFRARYAKAYLAHHSVHWEATVRLREALDGAAPHARALERLNTLRALGRPLGRPALEAYHALSSRRASCDEPRLEEALLRAPACPACGLSLDEAARGREVEEALRRLHDALARQQARLASEAVRRILARGGARLEQFLQVVQASDLTGLAQVLDDELLAFLAELLAEPVTPTREALDLFAELARAYPVVSEADVDALVGTLRQLLVEQLAAQRESDPSRPPAFLLASGAPRS
jgi:hypothetical protein